MIWCGACNDGKDAAKTETDAHAGHAHEGETADEHAAHAPEGEPADEQAAHAPEGETADPHAGQAHEGESAEEHAAHADAGQVEPEAGAGGGHEGHGHADLVQLTPEQLRAYGVETSIAKGGEIDIVLALPGEIAVNADTTGHVLPKLSGVVQKVTKNIGDQVKKGELMVVIESRELAAAKSEYLSARERVNAAQGVADREKALFDKGVSPEQDYISAKNELRSLEIELTAAEQALHAIGISEAQLEKIVADPHSSLTRYDIYAPVSGRVLEKHASLGEMVSAETEMFLIADLSTVWVNLSVSQKDLPRVREGQKLAIRFTPGTEDQAAEDGPPAIPVAQAKISYIDALVAEDTRTGTARVVLPNPKGAWKPGLFVSGLLSLDSAPAHVLIPLEAVVKFEGQPTVFVLDAHGLEPRAVTVGRESGLQAEILSGLEPGEEYVSAGAYMVKAEFGKSEASHGH
jgi:membrane fusion protein, heavy metal efflux system